MNSNDIYKIAKLITEDPDIFNKLPNRNWTPSRDDFTKTWEQHAPKELKRLMALDNPTQADDKIKAIIKLYLGEKHNTPKIDKTPWRESCPSLPELDQWIDIKHDGSHKPSTLPADVIIAMTDHIHNCKDCQEDIRKLK